MPEFLELLSAYETWIEESAGELGIPVGIAKIIIEMEIHSGACDTCQSKQTCPARAYLIARDTPADGMPASEA